MVTQSFIIPPKGQIDRRRKLADVMAQQGMSAEPIQSWTQGAARLAQSLAGAYGNYQANQMDQQRQSALAQALQGGGDIGSLAVQADDPMMMQLAQLQALKENRAADLAHQRRQEDFQRSEAALSHQERQATHDLTASHYAAEEAQAGQPKPSDTLAVRKDYENQPGISGFRTVAPQLQSMSKSLNDPSAVADLDFVYGVAKIMDPQSVVRESEGRNVIASQSIPQTVLGQLNKFINSEQALAPEVRRNLFNLAHRRAAELYKQAQGERAYYTGNLHIGEDQLRPLEELPAEAVAPPVVPPQSAAAAPASLQPGHVEDGYQYQGGNPADPKSWRPAQ